MLRLIIILKELRQAQHSFISKVTCFGPFDGASSDLYTRTHEGNYTIICITLKKEISSFRGFIKLWIAPYETVNGSCTVDVNPKF